ncbi:MAG: DUF1232 domain-containing protein [Chloroflexota bacterium]
MNKRLRDVVVLGCAALAVVYLGNPGAGVIELIPDNAPIIGNLDEAGAVLILVSALRYYGVDVAHLFNRNAGGDDEEASVS